MGRLGKEFQGNKPRNFGQILLNHQPKLLGSTFRTTDWLLNVKHGKIFAYSTQGR